MNFQIQKHIGPIVLHSEIMARENRGKMENSSWNKQNRAELKYLCICLSLHLVVQAQHWQSTIKPSLAVNTTIKVCLRTTWSNYILTDVKRCQDTTFYAVCFVLFLILEDKILCFVITFSVRAADWEHPKRHLTALQKEASTAKLSFTMYIRTFTKLDDDFADNNPKSFSCLLLSN